MKKVMDRGWRTILAFVMVTALGFTTTEAQTRVSLQVFYDELQPYGSWMDYGNYGYVWIPRVERGFVPYATNGYWINTDYGNTWVSDYSWGWAPFHYGRWLFDDFYGWMWVPDTQWAPAWVAWRSGGGYYGWAPLMPGMGIHSSFYYYNNFPNHYWNFVPYCYITYRQVHNHCVPRPQVVKIINHTTIITHNHSDHGRREYFTGPDRDEIEHRGGGRVTVHKIDESDRPGRTEVSRNTARFYRPAIDNSPGSSGRPIPSTFLKKDRQANAEQIEPSRSRTSDVYRYRNSQQPGQQKGYEPQMQGTSNSSRETQRREYQPTFESQNRTRTYERIPQDQKSIRDRYDAPPVERAPAQRRVESDQQFRQWKQAEGQNHERSVQSNYRRSSSGTDSRPSTEFRKRESSVGNHTPSKVTSGHGAFRKSN